MEFNEQLKSDVLDGFNLDAPNITTSQSYQNANSIDASEKYVVRSETSGNIPSTTVVLQVKINNDQIADIPNVSQISNKYSTD